MWEAERILGKNIIKILPDHTFYLQVSNKLMDYMRDIVWSIEVFSIDEFFTDVTNIWERNKWSSYVLLAEQLKNNIYKHIGVPVSIWISNTRIKAKIFSDLNKPFWSYVSFNKENIENLFKVLKVSDIPYIAKWNSERLWSGVKTIFDFYSLQPLRIKEILWKNWLVLWLELHGADVWLPHDVNKKRKSIVCSRSFNHTMTMEANKVWMHCLENIERAYNTLVMEKQEVRNIWVFLKDKDFKYYSLYKDLWEYTIDRKTITRGVRELFLNLFQNEIIYRTTWIQFNDLQPYIPKQMSLFDIKNDIHLKNDNLSWVVLWLKNRYWNNVINIWFVKHKNKSCNNDLGVLFEVW